MVGFRKIEQTTIPERPATPTDARMVAARHYNRPPIVEAVIDLKFEGALSEREFERLRDQFKREYLTVEERKNISVQIHADKVASVVSPAGFKMTAQNAVDVVLINLDSIGSVRLAPYERWENLATKAKENFQTFTKVVGRKTIVRIGVRFINRIDIPNSEIEGRPFSDFIKVGVSIPMDVSNVLGSYSLAANGIEVSTGAKIVVQSATVPPALISHTSILLDIDAYWDHDISGRLDEMWASTDVLRNAKNAVFEQCITDEVRELFQ
jgi:uncharacterized protein (TIGR04255 family)